MRVPECAHGRPSRHQNQRRIEPVSAERSAALWNRRGLDLRCVETLAQILDRGSLDDWRALYAVALSDPDLRKRIRHVVETVPIYLPHFWLAALAAAGEPVDFDYPLPPPDLGDI